MPEGEYKIRPYLHHGNVGANLVFARLPRWMPEGEYKIRPYGTR
jgi:hypothetical protein